MDFQQQTYLNAIVGLQDANNKLRDDNASVRMLLVAYQRQETTYCKQIEELNLIVGELKASGAMADRSNILLRDQNDWLRNELSVAKNCGRSSDVPSWESPQLTKWIEIKNSPPIKLGTYWVMNENEEVTMVAFYRDGVFVNAEPASSNMPLLVTHYYPLPE